MLISASEVRVCPLLVVNATLSASSCGRFHAGSRLQRRRPRAAAVQPAAHRNLLQRVQQLAAKIVDRRGKNPDPRGELVVRHHRRHGHKQSRSRGDQRLADARRHGPQRRRARRAQPVKRVHHAHHRAEQPDKRARRPDRRQPGHPPLQRGHRFAGRGLRRALQRRQVARRARPARLPLVGLVHVLKDLRQRAGAVVVGQRRNLLQPRRLAERADELPALPRWPC